MLESIQQFMPQFKGEVLIGDNGSDEKERTALEDTLKHMRFDYRLLKFDRHYPITAGKNKLHRECRKKWIRIGAQYRRPLRFFFTKRQIQPAHEIFFSVSVFCVDKTAV